MTSDQLNAECAKAMGVDRTIHGFPIVDGQQFEPSTDMNDALRLVEKAREWGCDFVLHLHASGKHCFAKFESSFHRRDDGLIGASQSSDVDTAPRAICLAFLELAKTRTNNGDER